MAITQASSLPQQFVTDINQDYDFMGSIAEVRVWNTLINEQTIQNWHCNHLNNTHPNFNNLIGYWKLNEGFIINSFNNFSENI